MSKRRRNHYHPPRNEQNQQNRSQNKQNPKSASEEAVFPNLNKDHSENDTRTVNDAMSASTWGFLSRRPSGYNPQKKFNPDGINDKKVRYVSLNGGMKSEMNGSIIDEIQGDLNMELPSLSDIGVELSMHELQLNSMDFCDMLDSENDDSILEGILSDEDD